MEPGMTILRVKRKRGTEPAEALLLACKRIRAECGAAQPAVEPGLEPEPAGLHNSLFKLVATVASQDAPVQTHVRKALARPRLPHAQRPSHGSSQRIIGDLRNTKWSTRREERYRILSSHRPGLPTDAVRDGEQQEKESEARAEPCLPLGDVQVVDIVQEEMAEDGNAAAEDTKQETERILCNSMQMIREKLSVSGGVGTEHREKDDDYVYDLYYQETSTPGWIQDILSVRPYAEDGELVPDEVVCEEEVYEDDDDENAESNWRNDYPDEGDSGEDSDEERYGGCWSEELSHSRRSWERYQREVLKEVDDDDDDDDNERDDYDFD